MLSIQGTTLAEVFANIAGDERYNDQERESARKIAEYETKFSEVDWSHTQERDPKRRAEIDQARQAIKAGRPYQALPCEIDDQRLIECDRLVWTIRPYTAAEPEVGPTMNVGVNKV